ncbi:hypothetical protein [Fundicoccus ignavus]|uniref:hypothetical protein n=1 Tax=Fundicoccus ignavus TaxID=2664442 RepID=UPI001C12A84E|nr:hypothetical protein [Fundicoccus ignavus]
MAKNTYTSPNRLVVHEILTDVGYSNNYRAVAHYWHQIKQKTKEDFISHKCPWLSTRI